MDGGPPKNGPISLQNTVMNKESFKFRGQNSFLHFVLIEEDLAVMILCLKTGHLTTICSFWGVLKVEMGFGGG